MTKRTFHYITECGWLLLALLPLFLYMIVCANFTASTFPSFVEFMSTNLAFLYSDNVIYEAIYGVFGSNGSLPILGDSLVLYLTYYVVVELAHLLLDVLLFIPRLAHGWMSAFSKKLGE